MLTAIEFFYNIKFQMFESLRRKKLFPDPANTEPSNTSKHDRHHNLKFTENSNYNVKQQSRYFFVVKIFTFTPNKNKMAHRQNYIQT
jgi:hypothetical protein